MSMIIARRDAGIVALHSTPAKATGLRDSKGAALERTRLAEILQRARAGQVDEPIEFDARVYRQQLGKPLTAGRRSMLQNVLIRPKAMRAMARSMRGRPFVDGHDWSSTRAAGGTIADAWIDVADDTDETPPMTMSETIQAVKPWAVEGVLDGTIREFSIAFLYTGDILCSVHNAKIGAKCYCMPGQRVGEPPAPDVPDERPMAQWIVQAAEGVETSSVNVPAVGGGATGIDAIRASLDAVGLSLDSVATTLPPDVLAGSRWSTLEDLAGFATLSAGAGLNAAAIRDALAACRRGVYDDPHVAEHGQRSKRTMNRYLQLAAALALTVPTGEALDEAAALNVINARKAEADLWKSRAERAEAELARLAEADKDRTLDAEIAAAYDAGKLTATVGADGKTRVADPQEASLRTIGKGLGLDTVKAHIASMPQRMPARAVLRAPVSEGTPDVTPAGGGVATAEMRMAAAQLGLKVEDMIATAATHGRH